MIYKYDDIVKTIKGKFMFSILGSNHVGKMITVHGLNSPGNCFGGRIDKVCEDTIIYKREFIEDGKRKYTSSCITAEGIGGAPDCKICIYDPMTGEYIVYRSYEFVHGMKSKIEFNTDILRPGAKFYMEANGGCGIVKVLDCGKNRLCFKEDGFIGGIRYFGIDENTYDPAIPVIPNPIQLKTLDELTSFDLFKRGFNGDYKLRASTIAKIKDILDEEDKSDDE